MHLKVALSIALIVIMELFLNRSVKIHHLAALKNRENYHSTEAKEMMDFNGPSFYASSL